MERKLLTVALLVAAACAAWLASGSQLIDRGANSVSLKVNTKGEALLSYHAGGRAKHVLVWGAINARQPSETAKQVKFRVDYAGGWGKYHRQYWRTFTNRCRPYTGPPLPYLVKACDAPDGSHWAVQQWHIPWPDLGYLPWTAAQRKGWMTVSHWTGETASLETHTDWVYGGRYQEVFGRALYRGQPVYGFGTTRYGARPTATAGSSTSTR